MIRVKVCGMASLRDVEICADAGADALGFIFAQSPRRLSVDDAAALCDAVPALVTTVGVFANDPAELVRSAIERCRIDVLQFSGDETPEFCGSFGKPTIVAARNRRWSAEERSLARTAAILVDSWSAAEFGGTGRLVDATVMRRIREQHGGVSIVLAGGLTPANVGASIRASAPDGVDVRTGVERGDSKDLHLVRAFVAAAHAALS